GDGREHDLQGTFFIAGRERSGLAGAAHGAHRLVAGDLFRLDAVAVGVLEAATDLATEADALGIRRDGDAGEFFSALAVRRVARLVEAEVAFAFAFAFTFAF